MQQCLEIHFSIMDFHHPLIGDMLTFKKSEAVGVGAVGVRTVGVRTVGVRTVGVGAVGVRTVGAVGVMEKQMPMLITENGANMIKAFTLILEKICDEGENEVIGNF